MKSLIVLKNTSIAKKVGDMMKKFSQPGDVHTDENGEPVFYGAIEKEIAMEHRKFNKMFDIPSNPAFSTSNMTNSAAKVVLPSLLEYCTS